MVEERSRSDLRRDFFSNTAKARLMAEAPASGRHEQIMLSLAIP
jgi:hypothetical protein